MKLDIYKIDLKLAERGGSMRSSGFDYRWIQRAKAGHDIKPGTVYKIAQNLGCSPEEITIRE